MAMFFVSGCRVRDPRNKVATDDLVVTGSIRDKPEPSTAGQVAFGCFGADTKARWFQGMGGDVCGPRIFARVQVLKPQREHDEKEVWCTF